MGDAKRRRRTQDADRLESLGTAALVIACLVVWALLSLPLIVR